MYEKVKRNAPEIYPPSKQEQLELMSELVKIAKENKIFIKGCYEGKFLETVGVDCSGCQTKEIIEFATNQKLSIPKSKNARGNCNCLLGQDIGAYNTCLHLCKYCYANADKNIVMENARRHNPHSSLLVGEIEPVDKITVANQKSYKVLQTSFFD